MPGSLWRSGSQGTDQGHRTLSKAGCLDCFHICGGVCCGLKQDEATHAAGPEATETTAQTCTVCGYELAPALGGGQEVVSTDADASSPKLPKEFPWWIIPVIVAAIVVVVVVLIKKKKQ